MDNIWSCHKVYRDTKFTIRIGARGYGRLAFCCLVYGTEKILCDLIRLKLKYPFYEDVDLYISRVLEIRARYGLG